MKLIGFDIGGTKCAVSLGEAAEGRARVLARRQIPTPARWQDALEALFAQAETLLEGSRPDACGFSCGGPLDAEKGLVLSPPNLPGWDRVPLTALAARRFDAPCFLENDANACALAEWRWGAGQGSRNMAFLTFGTGLGAGLILEGRLIRGANGNAGEAGHIRLSPFGPAGYGKEGSFEGFCSGGGIAQLAATLGRRALQNGVRPAYYEGSWDAVTAKSVAGAANAGDETARAVFGLCGEKLGEGLSVLIDILNPEVIALGGVFMRNADLFMPIVDPILNREALPLARKVCRIVPAELGETLAKIGKGAERIRLVGFDDVEVAAKHNITSARQPLDAIAEVAMQTLVSRIKTPDLPPRTILLDAELVVR